MREKNDCQCDVWGEGKRADFWILILSWRLESLLPKDRIPATCCMKASSNSTSILLEESWREGSVQGLLKFGTAGGRNGRTTAK